VESHVHQRLSEVAPAIPRVSVRLAPESLLRLGTNDSRTLGALEGATVQAILAIADPDAFVRQLEHLGARVHAMVYPDHHAFDDADVQRIVGAIQGGEVAVCTLKDAVKLTPLWPRLAPPLWYVSQQVMVERGVGGLERVLDDLVRARSSTSPTAG
jgi:tetraacyldisaccharide 4'-kinase